MNPVVDAGFLTDSDLGRLVETFRRTATWAELDFVGVIGSSPPPMAPPTAPSQSDMESPMWLVRLAAAPPAATWEEEELLEEAVEVEEAQSRRRRSRRRRHS